MKMTGLPISTFGLLLFIFLGAEFVTKKFRNPQKGMDELKQVLKTGQIVGMTTNMYWLPYLSERFRWNFLGHNIIALRETDGVFRISDSMLEHPIDCPVADLERARFAPGPANPHGYMYYLKSVNPRPDLRNASIKGMKSTCFMMLNIPMPIFGVRGMRFLAKKVIKVRTNLALMKPASSSSVLSAGWKRLARAAVDSVTCMPLFCRKLHNCSVRVSLPICQKK